MGAGKRDQPRTAVSWSGSDHPGAEGFIEPTIFDGVTNAMKIAREEIFGPVLSVIPQGNDTSYGLAAAVWTRDVSKALKAAHYTEVKTVWVDLS